MDSQTLVNEQIEAGAEFLKRFAEYTPYDAAFWLRLSDSDRLHLYIASKSVTDKNIRLAYGEVLRIADEVANPNFDPFQVKLIWITDPMAQAAIAIYQRYSTNLATRFNGNFFGGRSVDEVYVYPPARAVSVGSVE